MNPSRQPLERPADPSGLRPLRVLVVEDSADTAASLALLVRLYGHEAYTAADGPAALAQAEALRPDVVLLDIGLPGLDGWQVARRLLARPAQKRPFLIAVTGFGAEADLRRSREAGVDLHLTKPAEPELLRGMLGRLQRIIS